MIVDTLSTVAALLSVGGSITRADNMLKEIRGTEHDCLRSLSVLRFDVAQTGLDGRYVVVHQTALWIDEEEENGVGLESFATPHDVCNYLEEFAARVGVPVDPHPLEDPDSIVINF